jgi:hypothetical protein
MTRVALLAQIANAFGPEGPLDVLAQDLANAQARQLSRPVPASPLAPVAYVHPGRDPAEYLLGSHRLSLPWLEPAQLQRHLGTLLRLSLEEDREPRRVFEMLRCVLGYLLAPEALPSVRAHYRALLAPLTAPQRAAIAAVVRATAASEETVAAWTRVVAHDCSGDPGPWYDVLWQPQPPVPDAEALIALWQDAFAGDATAPLPDLSDEAEVPFYLPFVSLARMEALLPRFAAFVLREPAHAASPTLIRQLHALFQPFQEPHGAPLLRERLAGLSRAQRRAVHGLACYAFPADDLLMLWEQAAALDSPDWLHQLTRPEWDPADWMRSLWLESVPGPIGSTARPPPPRARRDHASVARLLEEAFDGVAAPGHGERTLFEAEALDSYGAQDVARGRAAHRGRWQDLPTAELQACRWALAFLRGSGLQYYAPAIMLRYLHWSELGGEGSAKMHYLGLFESIAFVFTPSVAEDPRGPAGRHDRQRDYMRERLAPFTAPQRRAIHRFLEAIEDRPDVVAAWARVVAHDEAGSPGSWFDVLWPPSASAMRARPDPAAVRACLLAAFPDVHPPSALASDRAALHSLPSDAFVARLAEEALFVLTTADVATRDDSLQRIAMGLEPNWRASDHDDVRARLITLNAEQRRAVSAFCDLAVEKADLREMWRRAAADEGADWFASLKLP